jgi:hypothetical protein
MVFESRPPRHRNKNMLKNGRIFVWQSHVPTGEDEREIPEAGGNKE